jgi:hypothetical protein
VHRVTLASLPALAVAGTLALGALRAPADASSSTTAPSTTQDHSYTFAVIGDVPYGDPAQAAFPAFIEGINADPDVRLVTHLGDIKSGSTTCDDQRFAVIRHDFDHFKDPLVYTPGDNEWTDCHRANNGAYQPLERLAELRSLFFSPAGTTLGAPALVRSEARLGIPENVRYQRAGLSFATLHVVGSNDDLAPWTGLGNTTATPDQVTEEQQRMRAAIANLHAAFELARRQHLHGVVLQQQADMFDPTVTAPAFADYSAFQPLVQAMVNESRHFSGPVYLFNGDSHRFNVDRPLASGSSWLSFYGITHAADNLQRVTVDGSDLGEADWLKVTVHRRSRPLLTFEQVPGT